MLQIRVDLHRADELLRKDATFLRVRALMFAMKNDRIIQTIIVPEYLCRVALP
jgi:hypothetical protein